MLCFFKLNSESQDHLLDILAVPRTWSTIKQTVVVVVVVVVGGRVERVAPHCEQRTTRGQ